MFDIIFNSQVVGNAEVIKEGLYYRFVCSCTPPDSEVFRIIVSDGSNTKDLGICVPNGKVFSLVCRVPVKYLPGKDLSFTLQYKNSNAKLVPVSTDEPFEYLDQLDCARLETADALQTILIDPAPDPQDSDPSQGSPNKWEQP